MDKLSPGERKKAEKAAKKAAKEREKWKLYIDYLYRHLTIVTSKYVTWEKNEFELFKGAIEKAQRLDEKDQTSAVTLAKLKQRLEILETKKYFSECNMVKKYFDFITRMRQLSMIAKDFIKVAKGARFPVADLEHYYTAWANLVTPKVDISVLQPNDVDLEHPGMKYVRWLCLFRTLLYMGNKFVNQCSLVSGLYLNPEDRFVGFNLSEDQVVIIEHFSSIYAKVEAEDVDAIPGLPKTAASKVEEIEDKHKLPGESKYLTFQIRKAAPQPAVEENKEKSKQKK